MPLHYLAYGSNLHPLRLRERVPSATLLGTFELRGRKICFSKRSVDGSGKCTVPVGGASRIAYGAVFRIDEADRPALDRAEGFGKGYEEQRETLKIEGRLTQVFFYVASADHFDASLRPYRWYKQLVLAGARYHRFPPEYVAGLEAVPSVDDPDPRRRAANEQLLRRCMAMPRPGSGTSAVAPVSAA